MTIDSQADPRKVRARKTRQRIVAAAYKLFAEHGYGVPLTAIAIEAGVAVQTLYFTFHTKPALLSEVLVHAVLGEHNPLPPHEQPWMAELVAEPDARRAMQLMVEGTSSIYQRVGPLVRIFKSGDNEVAAMWAHSEKLRLEGFMVPLRAIAKKSPLRPGLDLQSANDILFVMLSIDNHNAFVVDRGWTLERWREWVAETTSDALFGPRSGP